MSAKTIIGVDLGGTKLAAARYRTDTWECEEHIQVNTNADKTFAHVQEELIKTIETLRTDSTNGVGIGVPGLVSQPDGIISILPNIPDSEDAPIAQWITEATALPVAVDNDANCFTLAEQAQGVAEGHSVAIGVTLGTGVGGGIVINGRIFHGSHGYAGEIGHMLLQPGQPPFASDNPRGEVEQFFSGTAMGKRCAEASDPGEYLEGEVCAFMHKSIYQEVAWMCTNLIHLLDPSIIVFGGSAGYALQSHLPEIQAELSNWLLPGTPLPILARAKLQDAGTRGAALLLKERG